MARLKAALRSLAWQVYLRALCARDGMRLRRLMRLHPGLEIDPTASTNFAAAHFQLDPGAVLRIGARADTDRLPGRLVLHVGSGAEIEIGAGSWIRTDIEQVRLVAFEGARLTLGPDSWLNGCQLSAKTRIDVGEGGMIGPGTRIYDSNHAIDADRPDEARPVRIGEFTWIASDATVLAGVDIGGHCIIGSRAIVTRSIPAHTVAVGIPARPAGRVGTRRAFM